MRAARSALSGAQAFSHARPRRTRSRPVMLLRECPGDRICPCLSRRSDRRCQQGHTVSRDSPQTALTPFPAARKLRLTS